ncbi:MULTISPECIES: peptidoglycan DD-metalloendopeptidase family protein [unclassified Rudaea]|uniref:peptidoglycan DD-metalloendopeptidase family protein n=1 Tax=unclassified Rudaea TaxID=2627037 RepID=UPI0024B56CB8|nr:MULTISPECIES: peptidoglycan DD-metalloendopeptidase family protein [unclassified Rudaea]
MKSIFGKFRSSSSMAALVVCAVWLAGCASDPADVEDRSIGESPSLQSPPQPRPKPLPPGGSYRVVKGDTLYSIAFKRGLDYRDVAAWNGISAPEYKILVGQEIRFSPPGAQPAAVAARPVVASAAPVAAASAPAPASAPPPAAPKNTGMFEDVPNEPAPAAHSAQVAVAAPPATPPPSAPAASTPPAVPVPPAVAPAAAAKPSPEPVPPPTKPISDSATASSGGITWRWPNGGKVIGTFVAGDQTKQGVDIAGAAGDPVIASADGEVVYSGNGLLGYGELIIVKHNTNFLSAYGHNRKRLVVEGDKVRAGQQIAEMGSSASSRDELHFEIRKNGKPVNPLDYLPSR